MSFADMFNKLKTAGVLLSILIVYACHASSALANVVPPFVPNVVDESKSLSSQDRREINAVLQEIREKSDIWGAVLIIKKLEEDTIESLTEKVFRKWELGREHDDNGLLLVLSLEDRASRFEVGYGLEGDLPDVIALRALDEALAPHMRENRIKEAIIESFRYMGQARDANKQNGADPRTDDAEQIQAELIHGSIGFLVYFVVLWIVPVWVRGVARRRAAHIARLMPDISLQGDLYLYKKKGFSKFTFKVLLTIVPGFFLFVLCAQESPTFLTITSAGILFFAWFTQRDYMKRYASPEAYRAFIAKSAAENAEMVRKGHKRELAPGYYEYTEAYYASNEHQNSSDSDSSSSGGGSSGGGGASSGW